MTTKHAQLATELRARVERGQYADGLPSESRLMKDFEVSRTTVRAALSSLQNDGLLRSESGVGYFVRKVEHSSTGRRTTSDGRRWLYPTRTTSRTWPRNGTRCSRSRSESSWRRRTCSGA